MENPLPAAGGNPVRDSSSGRDPVEALAEEFVQRYRQGDRPTLQEYADRYPQWADQIRAFFPALVVMERVRPGAEEGKGPNRERGGEARLERLGDYRILRELGRGGMGVVYEALQESLGRPVALKVLSSPAVLDSRQLLRFQREAKAAARLHHTNIVPVHGVGEQDGLHYYVMQFIPGLGLDKVLDELKRLRQARQAHTSSPPSGGLDAGRAISSGGTQAVAAVTQSLLGGRFAVGALERPESAKGVKSSTPFGTQTRSASEGNISPLADASGLCPELGIQARSASEGNISPLADASGLCNEPGATQPGESSSGIHLPGQPEGSALSNSGWPYWRSVARIGRQVADALAYASSQGILHRDIRPSNLLLDTRGTVWITDFGLAKTAADNSDLTHSGDIVGTLRYMAPERFQGKADIRSDIYALGLTLYELLTLRAAFNETAREKLMAQVVNCVPPRPRKLIPAIPQDLETIVLKATAHDPAQRYQTPDDLAADLQRFLDDRPIKARRLGPVQRTWRWCRRNPALAAAGGLAVLSLASAAAVAVAFGIYQSEAAGRLRSALGTSEEQRGQLARTNADLEETDKRRREGLRLSASLALGQGLTCCDQDETARGLLWLARGLEIAPDAEGDLNQVLRINLAAWRRRVHALRAAFSFPDSMVADVVAFSPDRRTVLTGTRKGIARLWQANTGKPVGRPLNHGAEIRSAAFSPDGKVVVTCGDDHAARLWEGSTGQSLREPLRHAGAVWIAVFSPDGKTILTGSADKTARLWDAASGKLRFTLTGHEHNVSSVAFSPDSKTVATGGEDRTVRLWDVATGMPICLPLRQGGMVSAVAFSPDGGLLATGEYDGDTARLWKADTGDPQGLPMQHHRQVLALAFSPDGKRLATASGDSTARIWDTATGRHVGKLMKHEHWVLAVVFSPDGKTVLTGSHDRTARLWDAATGKQLGSPLPHQGPVTTVAFSPDGKRALTAGADQTLRAWDLEDSEPPGIILQSDKEVFSAAFSQDGRTVVTGSGDGTARVWDAATGRPLGSPLRHPCSVRFVACCPGRGTVVTVTVDGTARWWQPETGKVLKAFRMPPDVEGRLAWTRDGSLFLTSGRGDGGGVHLWRADTGRPAGRPWPHPAPVFALAFSADGTAALTGCGTQDQAIGEARLWDVATGQPRGAPWPHPAEVTAVAFNPDGRTALTGCADWNCRLWDVATGRPLGKPLRHGAQVYAAAFSPDGRTVLTGCHDGLVQLWDVSTRKPLGPPFRHGQILAADFSSDGTTILTAGDDRAARLWPVPQALAGEAERLVTWTQVLTGMELDATGAIQVMDALTWQDRRRRLDEQGGPPPGEPLPMIVGRTTH
jgi:WD40 repeat protein